MAYEIIQTAPHSNDLTGQTFGRLTAIAPVGRANDRKIKWLAICECGSEVVASGKDIRSGHTTSCGCSRFDHGQCDTPIYGVWLNMRQRCTNPNDRAFPNYGGRGITVCAHWDLFENFFADMGIPPEGHSLERRNNNGPYSPDNCCWATRKQQQNNTRRNHRITFNGLTLTRKQWAEKLGIKYRTLSWRFENGWSVERALTDPVRHCFSSRQS